MEEIIDRVCTKCEINKPLTEYYYNKSKERYFTSCKECEKKRSAKYQKDGYRESEKYVFYQRAYQITKSCKANLSAKNKRGGLEVMNDLNGHITNLWEEQDKKCHYTNVEMILTGSQNGKRNAFTVDRVDSTKGYVEGNIVLCTDIVNRMKQNLTINELYDMCKLIEKNIEKYLD